MRVRELPAVLDAYDSSTGVFYSALAGPKPMHSYVNLSRQIMVDGVVPLEKADFFQALPIFRATEAERARIRAALGNIQVPASYENFLGFEDVYIGYVEHVFTFGWHLVLSRHDFESPHLDKILAHELAHLNNGDSFVSAAFWALGKGAVENYTPLGILRKDGEAHLLSNQSVARTTHRALDGLQRGGWMGLFVNVALSAATDGAATAKVIAGEEIRDYAPRIKEFFRKWDVEADTLAQTIVPGYKAYLDSLAQTEQYMPPPNFAQSAGNRIDKHNDQLLRSTPPAITTVSKNTAATHNGPIPTWMIIFGILAACGIAVVACAVIFFLSTFPFPNRSASTVRSQPIVTSAPAPTPIPTLDIPSYSPEIAKALDLLPGSTIQKIEPDWIGAWRRVSYTTNQGGVLTTTWTIQVDLTDGGQIESERMVTIEAPQEIIYVAKFLREGQWYAFIQGNTYADEYFVEIK